MRALRREQHRRDARSAPGEPGTGVQGVAPVVAAADEQDDPAPVHPPHQLTAGDGQSGRRALHERTLRQPRHQLTLGRPYRLHAVRSSHGPSLPHDPPPGPPHTGRTLDRAPYPYAYPSATTTADATPAS